MNRASTRDRRAEDQSWTFSTDSTTPVRIAVLPDIEPGRLLDVGSGKGRFLAAARDAGWDVLGIEFSEGAAASSRARFDVEVVAGDFGTTALAGPFDVITMWHTLEHLPDPRAAVERAVSLLRPGGYLIVSVPNVASVQARLGGDRWIHLDLPRHFFHFTPKALSTLLVRCGLRVERIGHFYPEMEVVGLVQTSLNRAGLEQDVLYRFTKQDRTATSAPQVVASILIGAALVPAAIAWSVVAPTLRTGASIQVVAKYEGD